MEDGRAPDTDARAGLEAVWGREASATAPPAPRPDLEGLFGRPEPEAVAGARRPRRGPVLAGMAVAVVAAIVAAVVGLGGEDDPEADPTPRPGGAPATTAPAGDELGPPAWTAATVCPRFEDPVTGGGTTGCPLALDDERAYALVDAAGTPSLRALDAATGQVRWEEPFPEGARSVERLPSVVVVGGVGGRPPTNDDPGILSEVVALDPVTGERRWSRPGLVVGPVGRDHLVVDATTVGGTREVMSVVEAATGREVLRRESDAVSLFLHPCGGMVLASEDDRLTAHDVVDGSVRWSIPVPHIDAFHPLACDLRRIAYVESGRVVLLDAATGSPVGAVTVTSTVPDGDPQVLAIVGDTVVVGSVGGARGYRADAGLEELWHLPCSLCGPDVPVGPAGDGAIVLLGGEAVVRWADGGAGPRLDLRGRSEKTLGDDTLLAWGAGRLVVADTIALDRSATLALDDVRTAVAGATHVVVATRDEVRAYAREG